MIIELERSGGEVRIRGRLNPYSNGMIIERNNGYERIEEFGS